MGSMSDADKKELTYFVTDNYDAVVSPDDLWYRTLYAAVSCNRCRDVLVEYENRPVDTKICEKLLCDCAMVDRLVRIDIISNDLFLYIREYISGYFTVGTVSVDGVIQQGFYSLFPTTAARVPIQGDGRTTRSSCPKCGRNNQENPFGAKWINRRDIGDRQVFSTMGGGGLHITQRIVDSFSPEMRARLRLRRVPPIPILD